MLTSAARVGTVVGHPRREGREQPQLLGHPRDVVYGHVGFLAGMEGYVQGETPAIDGPEPGSLCHVNSATCHDMWSGTAPLGDERIVATSSHTPFHVCASLTL